MSVMRLLLGATVFIAACSADETPKATQLFFNPFGPAPAPAPGTTGVSTAAKPAATPRAKAAESYAKDQAEAAIKKPASMGNAVEAFKADLWRLITIRGGEQWVVAVLALVLGLVAVFDGNQFFQVIVLVFFVGVAFCFVLSQLQATWVGDIAKYAKFVASAEFALFIGYAAKKGWEGTQLVLGLVVGLYLFQIFQAIALTVPHVKELATHSVWMTVMGTLMVLLGSWGVDPKLGAGRFFGIIAPLFGSSLVSAALSYLLMLSCTLPGGLATTTFHVTVTKADIPSVFEYWYMIAYPMHSKAVGIFNYADKHLVIGKNSYDIDRILAVVLCVMFFYFGMRYQLRRDYETRNSDSLKASLLEKVQPIV